MENVPHWLELALQAHAQTLLNAAPQLYQSFHEGVIELLPRTSDRLYTFQDHILAATDGSAQDLTRLHRASGSSAVFSPHDHPYNVYASLPAHTGLNINSAELFAISLATTAATSHRIPKMHIISDSKNTVTKFLFLEDQAWSRHALQQVTNNQVELSIWEKIKNATMQMQSLKVSHVRSHQLEARQSLAALMNEKADELARLALKHDINQYRIQSGLPLLR